MRTKYAISALLALFMIGISDSSLALSPAVPEPDPRVIQAYRMYKDLPDLNIKTTSVARLQFGDEYIDHLDFAVLDFNTQTFQPYHVETKQLTNEVAVTLNGASNGVTTGKFSALSDDDSSTYVEASMPSDSAQGKFGITINALTPFSSDTLRFALDNNVYMPKTIEIKAIINGQERIVLSRIPVSSATVRFPKVTSKNWTISLTYDQPLRINELELVQDTSPRTVADALRFLAQPNHKYRVYYDSDRYEATLTSEAGNLAAARDVYEIPPVTFTARNASFVISDRDGDSVPDVRDNCVSLANADQADENQNGIGDACDDFDKDGVINTRDNCPSDPNYAQADKDSDGKGDVCDSEESRITEKYPWIPWVGIGAAALVLITLFFITARSKPAGDPQ